MRSFCTRTRLCPCSFSVTAIVLPFVPCQPRSQIGADARRGGFGFSGGFAFLSRVETAARLVHADHTLVVRNSTISEVWTTTMGDT